MLSSEYCSAQGHGQAAVVPFDGYVILTSGDTLVGKLRWMLKYIENNPAQIKFFADNGTSKVFNAGDIIGFGNYTKIVKKDFDSPEEFELEHYVSMKSFKKKEPVFMNRLINGKITVYQNRSSFENSSQVIEEQYIKDGIYFDFTPDGLVIGPDYIVQYRIIEKGFRFSSYYVSKEGGELIKLEKGNYQSLFPSLFNDCKEILEEVQNDPELALFKNFMIMAEVYNKLCGQVAASQLR